MKTVLATIGRTIIYLWAVIIAMWLLATTK